MQANDAHMQQFLEARARRPRSPSRVARLTFRSFAAGGKAQGGVQRGRREAHGDVLREVRDARAGREVFVERVELRDELRAAVPGERSGRAREAAKHGRVVARREATRAEEEHRF